MILFDYISTLLFGVLTACEGGSRSSIRRGVTGVEMDDRKSQVLRAIIDDYVSTAEPVGSRTIAKKYRIGVSPATIRNEMADLEELGYIEQPHTSAGRVPSSRGYRYYVDYLMDTAHLNLEEEDRIRQAFQRRIGELDTLIQRTTRLLSETTHYASLISGPQSGKSVFRQLQIIPISTERAMLVMVTESGVVENEIIEVPVEVTLMELTRISGLISERLRGQLLDRLNDGDIRALRSELCRYKALLEQTVDFLGRGAGEEQQERVYLGGTTNILGQPEFRDVNKVKSLFEALEQEKVVHDILIDGPERAGSLSQPVGIAIGEEIRYREMQDCSLITTSYRIGDQLVGRIGVLGPKRMEYAKVVAVVEEVAKRLSSVWPKW